jgi:hypothetical protein
MCPSYLVDRAPDKTASATGTSRAHLLRRGLILQEHGVAVIHEARPQSEATALSGRNDRYIQDRSREETQPPKIHVPRPPSLRTNSGYPPRLQSLS